MSLQKNRSTNRKSTLESLHIAKRIGSTNCKSANCKKDWFSANKMVVHQIADLRFAEFSCGLPTVAKRTLLTLS